jgi:hypothetical protein
MIMATTFTTDLASAAHAETSNTAPRPGIFMRILTAMMESRQRAAEREIERYILAHGGQLTDSIERDLSRIFGGPAGRKY